MLKRTLTIVFLAWFTGAGGALADPPSASPAQAPHPDPKMPPMPSMEGPDPTGDMAKPPLAKPATIKPATTKTSKTATSNAPARHDKPVNAKHAAAPGRTKAVRGRNVAKQPGSGKMPKSPHKAAGANGHVAVASHAKVKVRAKPKSKKKH
jgi:hypothetical protein